MADTKVEYRIKISDASGNSLGIIRDKLEGVGATVELVGKKAEDLKTRLINFNQVTAVIESVAGTFGQIASSVNELSGYYRQQAEVETKLQQVMRNTMGATDAEVQSIKELAAAQQKLGVIGDEVQLAGAQELATYMSKKDSLEKLLPVMNDIVAQQYGYTATAEGAVNIATMMGKVFSGQISALSRYGYTFSEAQAEILKFGTEEEKVATLSAVVEQSVGGVNQALAQTPAGKFVQLSNEIGDFKEKVGEALQNYQPFIAVLSETGAAALGFVQLGRSVGLVANSMKALNLTMIASPIGLVVTAVAALAAGLVYAYKNSEQFRNVVDSAWSTMKEFLDVVWQIAGSALKELGSALKPVLGWLKDLGNILMKYVIAQIQIAAKGIRVITGLLRQLFGLKDNAVAESIEDTTDKLEDATAAAVKAQSVLTGGLTGGAGGGAGGTTTPKEKTYAAGTVGAYEQAIARLREEEKGASIERMASIEREIRGLEQLKKAAEDAAIARSYDVQTKQIGAPGLDFGKAAMPVKMDLDIELSGMKAQASKIAKNMKKAMPGKSVFEEAQEGVSGLSRTMSSLSSIVGGAAGSWLEWGANVVQSIGQALPQIAALTATQKAAAGANFATAATGAMSSMTSIPIVGPILGIAAMASVIAAMLAIPKFAKGGIAYGPTLGMFGEYAGAANNPEVVAPLDKLQSMLDTGDNGVGRVVFKVSGRDLEGVLSKRNRINSRTR